MQDITRNALPGDPFEGIEPIRLPHPIVAARRLATSARDASAAVLTKTSETSSSLLNRVRNAPRFALEAAGAKTSSQKFGEQGNSFSINFSNSKAGGILRLERIRPVELNDQPDLLATGVGVESMVFLVPPVDVKPVFIRAHRHVQSPKFQPLEPGEKIPGVKAGGMIRESTSGAQAGKLIAADFADELVQFGIRFIEDIEDPEFALAAAYAMMGVQSALNNPEKTFGKSEVSNGRVSSAIDGYNPFQEIASELYDLVNPVALPVDHLRAL